MNKEELLVKLNQNTNLALRFINEVLYPRTDIDHNKLIEYIIVLEEFQKLKVLTNLRKLIEISNRPAVEGSDTDYTEGTSLNFNGGYLSLRDLLLNIEDLLFEIEKI